MRLNTLVALVVVCLPTLALGAPFEGAPDGFTLVAEDDCGDLDTQPHVVKGKEYVFSSSMVTGAEEDRTIVFDDDFCLLRYEKLNPDAAYKVDVVYVTESVGREQSLEANGHVVHETMALPLRESGRFVFDIPEAAYAEGRPVDLTFTKRAGGNAVVSYVRVWSDDPTPLPAKVPFWVPAGPIEKDWLRQDRLRGKPKFGEWTDPAKEIQENVLPCIDEQLSRGRSILNDLRLMEASKRQQRGLSDLEIQPTGAPESLLAESREELVAVGEQRDALLAENSTSPEAWSGVYRAARWAVRRLAFKNPLLESDGLLFVRRHHANHMHQCARRQGTQTLPGGDICILKGIGAEGEPEVVNVTGDRFASGTYSRAELSFDGQRIVFGYAPERDPEAKRIAVGYGTQSEATAELYAEHKVGQCEAFQVHEMPLDGSEAPRKLTEGPAENSDPLYLPDGRIAFMSHRPGGLVQCGDWALAYCVFTMDRDGSDPRQLTISKDGEWDPFLMDDGRIGFTRWEYVMKFWSPIQMIWSVRPDGTDPRLVYGSDLSKEYAYPLNYASSRQIPGTSKLACIGSAHHNTGAGPLCIVDLGKGANAAEGLDRITPVRFVETPDSLPHAGWYDCPLPLSENYFILSYSFSVSEADTTGYGLYLYDTYGGKELIYRDEELSAMFPVLLRPRTKPAALPELTEENPQRVAEYLIQNVHEGLDESAEGQARHVRIVETHERHIHTSPYAVQVGPDSGFETKTVLGTVPVEKDGSAYFRLPADKSVFFSVLDANYQALNTMRSVTNAQDGERLTCIGCHEGSQRAVPANQVALAALREPSEISPPPWGIQPMGYAKVVQPVLDRECISCHTGEAGGDAPDLTANRTRPYMGMPLPVSYYNLRPHVKHAPIYSYTLAPGTFGSRVSPLMELLADGHHGVELPEADWRVLAAWIDCNAPGIGDYREADKSKKAERLAAERAHLVQRRHDLADRRPDGADRRAMIADGLPEGERLVLYIDSGIDLVDEQGNAKLEEVSGSPYAFGAAPTTTEYYYDDISFDGVAIVYEVTGLSADGEYTLGFSWWDHNNAPREQSVSITTNDNRTRELMPKTALPAWLEKEEKPTEHSIALPADLLDAETVRISFTNRSESNAVVSEVWISERE